MKLFDTLINKDVEILDNKVNIYSCGPTVYNLVHIGNARPVIVLDTLIRYLEFKKYDVNFLMNITDIDDKIINAAKLEQVSELDLAKKYTDSFTSVLDSLNIRMPDVLMPISNKMDKIIFYIQRLVENGSAYVSNNDVYFDVDKFVYQYGKLSNQKLDELMNGVRIVNSDNKKSPLDFVLWKKTTEGLKYLSPWSEGRPGWHTECVALIDDYFKNPLTIHVGGTDLRFPHHENERIQNFAYSNKELAKIWMHIGHILLNSQKMSKSVGNIITVEEFLFKNSANDLRFIMISSEYSQPVNVSEELIFQAKKWNQKIFNLLKMVNWKLAIGEINYNEKENTEYINNFYDLMENNLKTSQVISLIDKLVKEINNEVKSGFVSSNYDSLKIIINTLGFAFNIKKIDKADKEQIKLWKNFIDEKSYTEADEIRKSLEEKNII